MRRVLTKTISAAVAVGAAFALAVVTQIVHIGEQVNARWFVAAAACLFVLAYRFYGPFLAAKALA